MKKKSIWRTPTFILTGVSILLFASIVYLDILFSSQTQRYIIQPISSSEVEVRVQSLEAGQQSLQHDLVFLLNQKLYYFGGITLVITFIVSFFGWRTFKDLDKLIQEKIRTTLEKELYQLDITNQKIWVVSNDETQKDMEEITKRLELSGLSYYDTVDKLDSHSFKGVSIIPAFNEAMVKEFIDYLERNDDKLFENKVAFILYTKFYRVEEEIPFSNYTFANMPVTAVSHVLTVGRGLPSTKPKKEDK